jgi:hypothetical protein
VVEDIVNDDLVLVKRVTITVAGGKTVSVSEKESLQEVNGPPDPQTDLMTAQVVFVADLIKSPRASDPSSRWAWMQEVADCAMHYLVSQGCAGRGRAPRGLNCAPVTKGRDDAPHERSADLADSRATNPRSSALICGSILRPP